VFHAAATGGSMSTAQAWAGALAYTLQLYFDFAGYSDMAIGLARMFGILFPANFNSPYRAVNISDFWRRWHITLSEWIRTRVFMKMTGRRATRARLYGATLVSMTLCGLWHGASWNFIFWGALHGLYLVIYYNWRALPLARRVAPLFDGWWGPLLARGLTFLCVVVGWVFFRARDWNAALALLGAMAGRGAGTGAALNLDSKAAFLWIAALLSLAWFAPNVQQWMAPVRPTLDPVDEPARRPWKPAVLTGLALGALLFLVVKGYFTLAPTQFLYFNF